MHIVRLRSQLTALIGHICWQGKTEFALHQLDRLAGRITFCGRALNRCFGVAVITGRKTHNQQANPDIFNQIAH
ncbi:hypothetical protein D3C80_2042480 [compost metagenome]